MLKLVTKISAARQEIMFLKLSLSLKKSYRNANKTPFCSTVYLNCYNQYLNWIKNKRVSAIGANGIASDNINFN